MPLFSGFRASEKATSARLSMPSHHSAPRVLIWPLDLSCTLFHIYIFWYILFCFRNDFFVTWQHRVFTTWNPCAFASFSVIPGASRQISVLRQRFAKRTSRFGSTPHPGLTFTNYRTVHPRFPVSQLLPLRIARQPFFPYSYSRIDYFYEF